ncbi:hypothetical protein C2G38_2112552 [Gigaspora rosea]|uniref:Phosphatidylglycerol/phosphatidylinositol transfer protein n=1 Tax=Gigaspora rosea TaxID=44941 RepID=A0A397UC26_9GLOM|nr:hypothetical protein C2G38_2112552 [Gigaspora rosea]
MKQKFIFAFILLIVLSVSLAISLEKRDAAYFSRCYITNETLRTDLNVKITPDPPIAGQNLIINTFGNATRSLQNTTIFVSLVMFEIPYSNYSRSFINATNIGEQFNTTNTAGPIPQGFNFNLTYIQVRMYEDEAQPPVGCDEYNPPTFNCPCL